MAKVSLNYAFDYPFANIDEVRFTLFVPGFTREENEAEEVSVSFPDDRGSKLL